MRIQEVMSAGVETAGPGETADDASIISQLRSEVESRGRQQRLPPAGQDPGVLSTSSGGCAPWREE
jgi:hypothetical protein